MQEEHIIVAGLNEAGQSFIRTLQFHQLKFIVLTNSKQEQKQLRKQGISNVLYINTNDRQSWNVPSMNISEVFIFESSLALSCRFVQCCRAWTSKSIYVITQQWNPRAIYKGLGADHIVFSHTGEVGFLLSNK
ncbi:NAD-binding protein [Paenibacillus sp. NRS-1760]|uniref:NAD-binding protein n=1 Tax=Paenibacillus sp. NRS-1760 TaxID=3233902 RepID=UPI003D2DE0C5